MQIIAINQQINNKKPLAPISQNFGARKITPKFVDLGTDVFERITKPDETSDIFYKHVENIIKRIKERMIGFTPEQLDSAILEVQKAHPDIKEKKILTVMQRLTQWADYNCFSTINHHLKPFLNGYTAQKFDHKNRTFHYLQQKSILNANPNGIKTVYFVDSQNIKLVKKHDTQKGLFINLEGFEDGVNFFSDNNELAPKTINIITKIKEYMKNNKAIRFNEALSEVLNGEIFDQAIEKNIRVHTIRRKKPATKKQVLEQMNPIQPKHPDVIKILFELLAKKYTGNNPAEFENLRNTIAQFFDYQFLPYSKQGMIEDLKEIFSEIKKYLDLKNIQPENTYILTLTDIKSYDLVTEMFAPIAKIPKENILEIDLITSLNEYKNKQAFIIVDDNSISGASLTDFGDYTKFGHLINKKSSIIFAPILAKMSALENIEEVIIKSGRAELDLIVALPKNIIHNIRNNEYFNMTRYFDNNKFANEAMGYLGYDNSMTAMVFPYSTPDNNCDMASFLTKYFLPPKASIDSKHNDFNEVEFEMNTSAKMAYLLQIIKNLGKN